jgi:hypothetical protein
MEIMATEKIPVKAQKLIKKHLDFMGKMTGGEFKTRKQFEDWFNDSASFCNNIVIYLSESQLPHSYKEHKKSWEIRVAENQKNTLNKGKL